MILTITQAICSFFFILFNFLLCFSFSLSLFLFIWHMLNTYLQAENRWPAVHFAFRDLFGHYTYFFLLQGLFWTCPQGYIMSLTRNIDNFSLIKILSPNLILCVFLFLLYCFIFYFYFFYFFHLFLLVGGLCVFWIVQKFRRILKAGIFHFGNIKGNMQHVWNTILCE